MKTEHLIPVTEIITYHKIEWSFIHSLHDFGLINVVKIEETHYIAKEQLSDLEKMICFHDELGINLEGIEAIANLLKRINNLNDELTLIKNRLKLYEPD